ncbi:transposable element Tcb2 transposase [Trichonephila clavipes]|nr:transposable element Tcb2 transposase [Trichonephila clavipes]
MVQNHGNWSVDQWATILLTDESRFSLTSDSRRTFIWREPRTHYLPSNDREINYFCSGDFMIWTGITLDGRTHLHFLESGIVIAVKYRDEILEPYFCLFTFAVDPDFISMDNKASLYRVHLIEEFQGFAG